MAMLNDVKFQVRPDGALKIARGGQKGTIATMEGYWEPITRELAEEMGPELMRDPRWVQAGMDPTRSASFYNRETMQPILEGEQVLHSGPLVLVKNPRYGDIEDFPFKEGGAVTMAKGGILGALAKTAEAGIERAAKTAKAMQQVLPAAEREANLAKFLNSSKNKNRLYHGTNSDFSVFDASRAGENTDSNASSEAYAQTSRLGHWLNTKPMAGPKAGYKVDMPVYVSIENPKREMSLDWLAQGLEGTTGQEYRNRLIREGYDGIVLPDEEFGGESWVAFSPEQIKSALGNRGTYDINDPDINKAAGGGVTIDEFLKRMKER
jgi:hypothetical protein